MLLLRLSAGGKRAASGGGNDAEGGTGDRESSIRALRNKAGTHMLVLAQNPLLAASYGRLLAASHDLTQNGDKVILTSLSRMEVADLMKLQSAMISQTKPKARYQVMTKALWGTDNELALVMAEHLKLLTETCEIMTTMAVLNQFGSDAGTVSWEVFHTSIAKLMKRKIEQANGRAVGAADVNEEID